MPAYQIQVRGTLDGATAFALPVAVPAPSNGGVIKIDAGVAINVGTFNLNTLALSDSTPVWLRAVHVEYAPLTRAARIESNVAGSRTADRVIPDQAAAAAAPLMRPYILTPAAIQPIGALLDILTDDTDNTFSGVPVAGPHFVYIDVEPIRNDKQMGLIQDLASFARAKADAEGEILESFQAVAATLVSEIAIVALPNGTTAGKAQVQSADVTVGVAPAAGESMVILVERIALGTGTATTIGTVTLANPGTTANSLTSIPLNPILNAGFNTGDRLRITRTYTAGMAPAPMTLTTVRVHLVPTEFYKGDHRKMSVKALLFDVTAAGSFDGSTSFSLPTALPIPSATGQYVIPVIVASGQLDPASVSRLMGDRGYWIRSAAINNQNVAVIRAMLAITQPKPSLVVGGNSISHPIFLQGTNAAVNAQAPIRRGPFVPPGWIIQVVCDDGAGTPIVGPYQLALELETLPGPADSARAIRSQEFPTLPVTIA